MADVARPLGVTLVAIVAWLDGAWNILQGVLGFLAGASEWAIALPSLQIIFGLLVIVVSLGLFRGLAASRQLLAVVFGLILVTAIIGMVVDNDPGPGIPSIVLGIVGIILLYTPKANAFFRA